MDIVKKFKYIFFLVPILIVLIAIVAFNLKSNQTSDDARWVYVNNDNVELGSGEFLHGSIVVLLGNIIVWSF